MLVDETIEIGTMIIENVRHHRTMAGKHSGLFFPLHFQFLVQFSTDACVSFRRGRGSYRGRGRGNFYRQDRGGQHQMQASHTMHHQAPNMHPYYNQPANAMQPNAGVNYHDANYHEMQANRYEMFKQITTTNFNYHVNDKRKLNNHQQGPNNAPPLYIRIKFYDYYLWDNTYN